MGGHNGGIGDIKGNIKSTNDGNIRETQIRQDNNNN